jgi:hypothetical protein
MDDGRIEKNLGRNDCDLIEDSSMNFPRRVWGKYEASVRVADVSIETPTEPFPNVSA